MSASLSDAIPSTDTLSATASALGAPRIAFNIPSQQNVPANGNAPPVSRNSGETVTSQQQGGRKRSQQEIARFWVGQGYPQAAAEGIAARAIKESGGDSMIPGDFKDGQPTSFGTYQHHGERWQALQEWAGQKGVDPYDPNTQDQFAAHELDQDMPDLKKSLMGMKDPKQAYDAFTMGFERPAAPGIANLPTAEDRRLMMQGGSILQQMMSDEKEGRAKVAKIDSSYKPIDIPPPPKPPQNDPLEAFSSPAGLFAILAAGFSRTPAIAAMNGLAGAIKAQKDGKWEDYKTNYDQWKTQTENMFKAHETHSRDVHDALEEMKTNFALGEAKLQSVMALSDDVQMRQHVANQDYVAAARLQQEREAQALVAKTAAPMAFASQDVSAAQQHLAEVQRTGDPALIGQAEELLKKAEGRVADLKRSEMGGVSSLTQFTSPQYVEVKQPDGTTQKVLAQQDRVSHRWVTADETQTPLPPGSIVPEKDARAERKETQGLLNDETLKPMVDAYIRGDKSQLANLGRGAQGSENIAKFREAWAKELTARGMTGADQAAAFVSFATDMREAGAIGTRIGAISVSGNEAKRVASLVTDAYTKLPRSEFRPFNELRSAVESKTNSPEQAAALAADYAMVTAYARALNPSGVPREADIRHGESMLSLTDSQESHAATVNQMLMELDQVEKATGDAKGKLIDGLRSSHAFPSQAEGQPQATQSGHKDGDTAMSKSGKHIVYRNGQWEYQ